MAKKDDFDLDDFDDLGDFSDPPMQDTTSRNPVLETASIAKRSALSAIWPKNKREEIILKGMPEQAEDAWKGYTDVKSVVSDVASHTKDELEKTSRVLKTQARQLSPTFKKYLPEWMTRRIDTWSRSDNDNNQHYDPNQLMMERELGQVFGGQADLAKYQDPRMARQAQKAAQEEEVGKRLEKTISNMKFDALLDSNIQIARSVHTMATLQSSLMVSAQKKSLELQYQHLFVARDMLAVTKSFYERGIPAIEAIVKNTGLPDYAKEQFGEIRGAMMKRKIAEWVSPLQYAEGFMDKIRENTKKRVSEVGDVLRGMIEGGASMVGEDDYDDLFSDNREVSPEQRAKNARKKMMETGLRWVFSKTLNPLRDKGLAKSKEWMEQNPQVMKFLEGAKYNLKNLSSISNSAASGERNDALGGLFETLAMLGIVEPYRRERVGVNLRDGETLSQSGKIDKRFVLSVTEVIPAWLKQIDSSVRRGQGDSTSIEYDLTSRGFITSREMGDRVRKAVANDPRRARVRESINVGVDFIDDGSLTEKDRAELSSFIESRMGEGKEVNVGQLIKDPAVLYRYMSPAGAERVQKILGEKSDKNVGGHYAISNEWNKLIDNGKSSYGSYQQAVDEMVAIHGERALRQAGIFHFDRKNDRFVSDKDLVNPLVDFNSLLGGKVRYGRERAKEDEIRRKMANPNSATGEMLRRKYGSSYFNDDEDDYDPLAGFVPNDGPRPPDSGSGGRFRNWFSGGSGGGVKADQLKTILFGKTNTNFVELLNKEGGVASNNADIVAAIDRANSRAAVENIAVEVNELKRLAFILARNTKQGKRMWKFFGKGGKGSKSPEGFFGKTWDLAKTSVSGVWNRGKSLAKWGWDKGASSRRGFSKAFRRLSPGGLFTGAVDLVGSGFQAAGQAIKHATGTFDVYDQSGKVVLQGRKLVRGEYYQLKNGELKPFYKLSEIDYDLDILNGDSTVAITKEDLKAKGHLTYFKDGRWYNLLEKAGVGVGSVARNALALPRRFTNWLSRPVQNIKDWATNFPDMYVQGEASPRLRANIMKAGGYFLKSSGEVIRKPGDVTGAIVDSQGNVVITDEEVANPNFKLVDMWGREVKTPIGRVVGRVTGAVTKGVRFVTQLPRKIRDGFSKVRQWGREGWERVTGVKDRGWFKNNQFFSNNQLGTSKRTNTILLRIYKLLNQRMSGDPEDESWTAGFDESTLGTAASKATRFAKNVVKRRARRMAKAARGKLGQAGGWLSRFVPDRYKKRGRSLRGAFSFGRVKNWFSNKVAEHHYNSGDFIGPRMPEFSPDEFVGPMPDDRSFFQRGRDNLRTRFTAGVDGLRRYNPYGDGFVGPRQQSRFASYRDKAKGWFTRPEFVGPRRQSKMDKLRGRFRSFFDRPEFVGPMQPGAEEHYRNFTGPAKPGSEEEMMTKRFRGKESIGDKLSRLISISEISWFDQMRRSAEEGGMPEGRIRSMFNKFGKRSEFKQSSEKSDFFKFFCRFGRKKKDGDKEDILNAVGGDGKKKGGILGTITGLIGGIVTSTMGYLAKTFSKGIFRGIGKLAIDGVGLALGTVFKKALPLALRGLGIAAGGLFSLPGMIAVGAGYAAYKIATTEYMTAFEQVRAAQYGRWWHGIGRWTDDDGAKILYLEDNLGKYVTYNGLGQATFRSLRAEDVVDLAEGYGIDRENKEKLLSFHAYITQRFIPIFLRWKTAVASVNQPGFKWDNLGDKEWKRSVITKIYNQVKSTESDPALRPLTDPRMVGNGDWEQAWEKVKFWADEEYGGPDKVISAQLKFEEVLKSGRGIGLKINDEEESEKETSFDSKDDGVNKTVRNIASDEAAKVLGSPSAEQAINNINKNLMMAMSDIDGITSADNKVAPVEGMVDNIDIDPSKITILESVRMKTYGLTNNDPAMVGLFLKLERAVYKGIDLKSGAWSGDASAIFTMIEPLAFGLDDIKDEDIRRKIIAGWFTNRFLPTLTSYVLAVNRYIPGADPFKLSKSGSYLYYVASLVVQSQCEIAGQRIPVWRVESWPFGGILNTNSGTVGPELKALQELMQNNDSVVDGLLKTRREQNQGRARWREKDRMQGGLQFDMEKYNEITKNGTIDISKYRGNGGLKTLPTGNAPASYNTPSFGVGGQSYQDYSNRQAGTYEMQFREGGSGNYELLKEQFPIDKLGSGSEFGGKLSKEEEMQNISLLIAAAKQLGIDDPTPLLSMASSESGFRWWVRTGMGKTDKRQTARGYYQFIDGTWGDVMKRYANSFGIPPGSVQTDPYANALLGAAFVKENLMRAKKASGGKVPITPGMAYLYHMGNGVGDEIMKALATNPNASAAAVIRAKYPTKRIPENNPGYFFKNQNPNNPRTVAEFMEELQSKATTFTRDNPGKIAAITGAEVPAPPMKAKSSEPIAAMGGAKEETPVLSPPVDEGKKEEVDSGIKEETAPLPASAASMAAAAVPKSISEPTPAEKEVEQTVEASTREPVQNTTIPSKPVQAKSVVPPNDTSLMQSNAYRDQMLGSIESTLVSFFTLYQQRVNSAQPDFGKTTQAKPATTIPQPSPSLSLSRTRAS